MTSSRLLGARPVVLSLNVGSSSLKAAVRDPALRLRLDVAGLDRGAGRVTVEVPGSPAEDAGPCAGWDDVLTVVAAALARRGLRPDVVAHRIVHGSPLLHGAVPAGGALLARLRAEADLDPLHLPRQLDVVDEACRQWPQAQVVLVSDSGFHDRLPDEAVALPLPEEVRSAGLRRWGFHGLAVQSVVDLVPGLGRAVVVHLGSGCSVTAVDAGLPRHTTMALSPAGGVPSLTRSGDLDPEVVLRLVGREGSAGAVRDLLNRRSGVAGLSGGRTDLRTLLEAEDSAADLAVRVFVRDVAMAVAAAVTTLDGWDSLVFTGGIGVHSAAVRERVCARLLPVRPGAAALHGSPSERLVATGLRVLAVPVDEEAVVDRLARTAAAREDEPPPGRADRDGGSGPIRVLVAVASRHGGTRGVAEAVADGIRRAGSADVEVRDAAEVDSVRDCDAVVVGSAVYQGHWLPVARDLVLRTAIDLWDRPVWAFSSGPVGTPGRPPEELLDVGEMLTLTRCREHRVFPGRLDRSLLGLPERAVVAALRAPEGDFRDLPAVTAWGETIGASLAAAPRV
ncbi:flavodoxin domain-containing protein [Geodermatophilus siccatus]|nr:flavodoxin domain-containing protein [Geodermatophilus siccatus]